ncbi:MAG TPA: family 10 glycosylhydrolase [Flavisolibacter sp.]|nr:family 10 glycosylhydrolase [Flavisolibacter sp.]
MLFRPAFVFSLLFLFILLSGCSNTKSSTTNAVSSATNPKVSREFRAAWVATVANINWPSKPGLSTEAQQQEAIALLDFLQKHHFNAVIFQVRPQADALYNSSLEPWSYFLTGEQGKAPNPYYDPLEFWIEAAHDRGLELHVWLNPYRAHHVSGKEISDKSIVKTNPELVVKLKEGYYWMDPAKRGTQDRTTAVVIDLVKRYDIDGVHFDDYFYPYPSYNLNEDFPDDASWAAYQASGGKLSRGDWRRESVNNLIERLYTSIKAEKPYVKFGLSPFGIWRPGYPQSVEGFDQYEKLYADARLWWNKGWVDYFSPQLYWPINRVGQSFPVLLGWWANENTKNRHLWPGISVGRDTSLNTVNETINQIMITRGMIPESKGVVHWSISSVTKNPKLSETLLKGAYNKKALVPASPWIDAKAPEAPVVTTAVQGEKVIISWTPKVENDVFQWVVYYQYGATWNYEILSRKTRSFEIKRSIAVNNTANPLTKVIVTAIDRTGNESKHHEVSIASTL